MNNCAKIFVNGQFWLNLSSKTRSRVFWTLLLTVYGSFTCTQRDPGKTVYDKMMCHGRSIRVIEIGVNQKPHNYAVRFPICGIFSVVFLTVSEILRIQVIYMYFACRKKTTLCEVVSSSCCSHNLFGPIDLYC